jgi:penicillin-binding protein 1C
MKENTPERRNSLSKRPRGRLKKLFKYFIAFSIAAAVAFVALWVCNPPPLEEAKVFPQGFVMRDASGEIIRVGLGPGDVDCRPTYVANRDDWIAKAIVAAEDARFFSHTGVRLDSVLRSIRQNVTAFRRVSGASTITMQTVRLIKPHKRSFLNKIFEAFKAFRLERAMTKEEILSQYLNRAPFGSNLVGIEAAAQVWFGHPASQLTLAEASLLAGLPQAPSRFRPDRNLPRALKRRAYVLDRMEALGMVTHAEREAAESIELNVRQNRRPFRHPWFCDWVREHNPEGTGDHRTTLDPRVQALADAILAAKAESDETYAVVVLSVTNSSVLAMTASGDYFARDAGQINAAAVPRLAGSTLKPFAYAMLADRGDLTPGLVLPDVPRTFGTYAPRNFSGGYRGLVTARDALVLSLNLPAIDIVNRTGVRAFVDKLHEIGFATVDSDYSKLGLGIVLGSVSVRLVDLAAAYAALARGGVHLPATAVAGRWTPPEVWKPRSLEAWMSDSQTSKPPCQAFSEGAAWMVTDMLSGEERSLSALGHVADVRLPRFAWKTGTSAGFRDAWTVAWNPEYVIAVWCGDKHGRVKDETRTGLNAAAPVAWQVIRALYPSGDAPWFDRPATVKTRPVCAVSGQAAGPLCAKAVEDVYIDGTTLWTPCAVHVRGTEGGVEEKWPPDVQAGLQAIGRTESVTETALKIVAPSDGTRYKFFDGIDAAQTAVIRVSGVGQGESVYWFVNGRMVKTTTGNAPLALPLERGTFSVTAATESGDADQVTLAVE